MTFDTLAHSRNAAAVDVLASALEDSDPAIRNRAVGALMMRGERRCRGLVLACWDRLGDDDLDLLRRRTRWIVPAVEDALKQRTDRLNLAIRAAADLELTAVVPSLVTLAESHSSHVACKEATDVVSKLVEPLGRAARDNGDRPGVRGPILSRLAESVRRYPMHRNSQLVDAFLAAATWGDGELRGLLDPDGPHAAALADRLRESQQPSVVELLVGFLGRRHVPETIFEIIKWRADEGFRRGLLRAIGCEPSGTALRNVRRVGLPACCRGGETLLQALPARQRAALAHLYVAAGVDAIETLHLVAAALELGGTVGDSAAAAMGRCEIPPIDFWMRAAKLVAEQDEDKIRRDDGARLLARLIPLLEHPNPAVVRAVRRILGPLHADAMLEKFAKLRARSRRRLGRVVMRVDPDAVGRIRDALRHPVLGQRLEAIAAADALGIVDLLADAFAHVIREDHQEARVRAAEVLSEAESEETLQILRETVTLPESPVRDAAIRGVAFRESRDGIAPAAPSRRCDTVNRTPAP